MRRSQRVVRHLNYDVYHKTGIKEYKEVEGDERSGDENVVDMAQADELRALHIAIATLAGDFNDFLDDYQVAEMEPNIEDYDRAIFRTEEFRSVFREKHRCVHALMGEDPYVEKYGESLKEFLLQVKEYLIEIREARKALRQLGTREQENVNAANERYFNFILDEVKLQLKDLDGEFSQIPRDFSDEELAAKNKNAVEFQKRLDSIWSKISEMMRLNIDHYEVDVIQTKHREVTDAKNLYADELQSELSRREIQKKENFKRSKLNIHLAKFSGYTSTTDIYSFQTEFEKIHLQSTPSDLLPDLLKNNFLSDPALSLVKSVEKMEEIWKRLKQAYGSPKILMQKKMRELQNLESGQRGKDNNKTELWISKIIATMKDLARLASEHGIEGMLYNGDGVDKVLKLLGESRVTRWLAKDCYHDEYDNDDDDYDFEKRNKESWSSLITFLEKELKILQRKSLVFQSAPDKEQSRSKDKDKDKDSSSKSHFNDYEGHVGGESSKKEPSPCSICGKDDHVKTPGPGYSQVVQYFSCEEWAKMDPGERFKILRQKNLCFQCLLPGADWNKGKHKEGKCQRDFVCKHADHDKFKRKKHVLVCEEHKAEADNQELLKKYKERCFPKDKEIPQFSKDISIHHCQTEYTYKNNVDNVSNNPNDNADDNADEDNRAIYQLQVIEINNKKFVIFYDNGCKNFLVRYDAIQKIGKKAVLNHPPPLTIGGVGGVTTESPYGEYIVKLPLHDGEAEAKFVGACLEKITQTFPQYPLQGAVEQDIRTAFIASGGQVEDLPKLPKTVGGDVDFMIGIKYLRYYPTFVFELPSGLTIYRSKFKNSDGGRGVIGGPHVVFDLLEKQFQNQNHLASYLSSQRQLYSSGYLMDPDVGVLGYKEPAVPEALDVYCEKQPKTVPESSINEVPESFTEDQAEVLCDCCHVAKSVKAFERVEQVGSELSFRCLKCRNCKDCKEGEHREEISLKEEVEDHLLDQCISLNVAERKCVFKMPVIQDPAIHLAPNADIAMKVYNRVLKQIKTEKNRAELIAAEEKLQRLGKVDYVRNLSPEDQEMLKSNPIQNFIPWRIVFKDTSATTPARIVFDGSLPTASGKSLNDILPKGRNNLNKLQEIFIRWMVFPVGFHTDIQTMYPSVHLRREDWCYQRYWWNSQLDPSKPPEEKVIMTCIFGIKCSGNIAEKSLRLVAELSKKEYPEVYDIIRHDTYMDDSVPGAADVQEAHQRADEMEVVLAKGSFTLKGVTVSGSPPMEKLSEDGESVFVGGMRWFPESDKLSFNIKALNFAKKRRGRKPVGQDNIIPERLTRKHCASKVAEIYDLCGKITPIVSSMKLDLHDLVVKKLDWDDVIPDNMRGIWENHFEMISEIKHIRYNRALVPDDAVSTDINTLDFGDASMEMACVAIYVRFLRRNGEYSCQLILGRSKIIQSDIKTQPRAEMFAALLNTHTGEIVKKALKKFHTGHIKFSDSQIALHWINSEGRPLNSWVRNRSIEIRRLTRLVDWLHTDSKNMVADIGTRRGVTLAEVAPDSLYHNGWPWMNGDVSHFPARRIEELHLSSEELEAARAEMPLKVINQDSCSLARYVEDKTAEMYSFSGYIIDPNKFNKFSKVVMVHAVVLKFIRALKSKVASRKRQLNDADPGLVSPAQKPQDSVKADPSKISIDESDIKDAENYYFCKATAEIKQFHKTKLKNLTEKDGILYFTGRILPDEVTVVTPLAGTMKDLQATTFCVPAVERHSPLAYAIVNDVHWNNPVVKHMGIETTWRYVLMKAYVMEGRDLVTKVRHSCERCRFLCKRTIEVAMGSLSGLNLAIAPAFYMTQLDLAGPFKAYCQHNRRSTIKIWLLVYCCTTTSATKVKVMEDYSTQAFINAFIRFSSDFGYPKKIQIDEGSQLVKGCETLKLDFVDIKSRLHKDVGVDFQICPVGGHNVNGRVERKIRQIKESLDRNLMNERLSILQWETMSSKIANSINDLPLALGNNVSNFESMDLITPNRLLLGRNNERSPVGDMLITTDPDKILKENNKIFQAWFENWLVSSVPNLIEQPKWYKTNHHLKVGDVVLFMKDEAFTPTYQYGMVKEVLPGKDGLIRKAVIRYRNSNEKVDRETNRAVRTLVVIHRIDEVPLMQDLYEMSVKADTLYSDSNCCSHVRNS